MSTEAELRRLWGADYIKRLGDARAVFRSIGTDSRDRIDEDNTRHIQALADMRSEAYTNARHPDHQRVSQSVNSVFNDLHFSDVVIF